MTMSNYLFLPLCCPGQGVQGALRTLSQIMLYSAHEVRWFPVSTMRGLVLSVTLTLCFPRAAAWMFISQSSA
jgi:hypothetical protein